LLPAEYVPAGHGAHVIAVAKYWPALQEVDPEAAKLLAFQLEPVAGS